MNMLFRIVVLAAWVATSCLTSGCGGAMAQGPNAPKSTGAKANKDATSAPSTGQPAQAGALGDFEDGTLQGWEDSGGSKVEVADTNASQGKKCLKVDLVPGAFPGLGRDFKTPQDWSGAASFRFSVFNAAKSMVRMSIRVDDKAHHRYKNDMNPQKLYPGKTEVELPIAALRQGDFLATGLDVDKITVIRIFASDQKEAATLYFDDFRLVTVPPTAPREVPAAEDGFKGFKEEGAEAKATIGDAPASTKSTLEFKLTTGKYPAVTIPVKEKDWLQFDTLAIDIKSPSATELNLKLEDKSGRTASVLLRLKDGDNHLEIPLEMVSSVYLGRVDSVRFFSSHASGPFTLTSLTLRHTGLVQWPTIRDDKAANPAVTVDLRDKIPANTCKYILMYIPLKDGPTRVVRCNSNDKGVPQYVIPTEAFEGYNGKPICVWMYVSDHGDWMFWQTALTYEGKPMKIDVSNFLKQ